MYLFKSFLLQVLPVNKLQVKLKMQSEKLKCRVEPAKQRDDVCGRTAGAPRQVLLL